MTGSPRRALAAAGLLAALLAALLGAWFVSGWADVRSRQHAEREAPRIDADNRGAELAHELRGELAQVIAREVDRPYFHYQNLFHDPRASAVSVAPSPLAQGPRDPLVLGYFQLDTAGRVTTPTINDELPELSDAAHLADNRRFRDEVARSLAGELAPHSGPLVASLAPPVAPRPPDPPPAATDGAQEPQQGRMTQHVPRRDDGRQAPDEQAVVQQPQVVTLDPSSYAQNSKSNSVYIEQRAPQQRAPQQRAPQQRAPQQRAPRSAEPQRSKPSATPPAPPRASADTGPAPTAPIAITVSPLEWRTQRFAGQPALVAVRQVETPDGRLAQGFVVDRAALTSWLAGHAGDAVAELRPGDGGSEIAPGWHLDVAPNPRAVIAAAVAAASIARHFVARFVAIGVVALLAAFLVVMLVARAERLARERSQFAAAAAHELRTPLAGLQLYGDMLADGLGDPGKLRDYARRMSEEASRLGRVVSNVLGFSQLERGSLSVDTRTGSLDDALRELADRAQPALDRAGATLALDVAAGLSARFDRDALARIIGNLLDNAEKYSRGADDRTITLAARAIGDTVEVTVSDHGPGVAARARPRLFQPFARGVTGDGPAGLGLGLALSQSLARAMGGDLVYRPDPDGGAAFVLTIPRT